MELGTVPIGRRGDPSLFPDSTHLGLESNFPTMKTLGLLAFLSTSLVPIATAQEVRTPRAAAAVRDAGILHVATGTWTRRAQQATLGPDVLYDNTCPSGFYVPLSGDTYVDEGRLPSPTSPAPTGCAVSYRIDGFTFSYCTSQTPSTIGTYTHRFYENYPTCSSIVGVTPTATFALTGLPASPSGALACWTVTVDLTGTGGGSFLMSADADGVYGGTSGNDRFGWAMSSTGISTGPFIAGDPGSCAEGAGTYFNPGNPGPGTGLSTLDQFRITGSQSEGCWWFGGYPAAPFASFDLRLHGTACEPDAAQTVFCAGDGAVGHTACPCGNNSAIGAGVGCLNSIGTGGKLRAFGVPSLANDTVQLRGSFMTNAACLYFQGLNQQNGGAGTGFGDGLRCAGGTVQRLGTKQNVAGASQYPSSGDVPISVRGAVLAPGTRTYQGWYRNSASFCTPSGFNLTNGVELAWGA